MRSVEDFVSEMALAYGQGRSVFFVTGSGTTCPAKGVKGVPSCSEIVKRIIAELRASANSNENDSAEILQGVLTAGAVDEAYKIAMEALAKLRGRTGVNHLIQNLVNDVYHGDSKTAQAKHSDYNRWSVREGVLAIGELLAKFPERYSFVLTTNFDPLLEVAIRAAGANPTSVIFNSRTSYPFDLGRVPVLHVHGFWAGDTMHSTEELTAPRPTLVSLLQREFESLDSQPVVIGYGGWTDNVMQVLANCIASDLSNKTLYWAIYPSGDKAQAEAEQILNRMNKLVPHKFEVFKERILFFCGVDSDSAMPQLRDKVRALSTESLQKRLEDLENALDNSSARYSKVWEECSDLRVQNQRLIGIEEHLRGRLAEKDAIISSQLGQLHAFVADLKVQVASSSGQSIAALVSIDNQIARCTGQLTEANSSVLAVQRDVVDARASLSADLQSLKSESRKGLGDLSDRQRSTSKDIESVRSALADLQEGVTGSAKSIGELASTMIGRASDVRLLKRLLVGFLRDHKASWRTVKFAGRMFLGGLLVLVAIWLSLRAYTGSVAQEKQNSGQNPLSAPQGQLTATPR